MPKPVPEFDMCPFTVVVDSNEGAPWLFRDLVAKGTKRPLVIKTVKKPLWSMHRQGITVDGKLYVRGLADYSIDGHEEHIQIERKSHEDLYGTLGDRRGEFEAELIRLSECRFACVIVECGWPHLLDAPKDSSLKPSSVIGSILAWQQRYQRVHWIMAGNRSMAERLAFRTLERFWEDSK